MLVLKLMKLLSGKMVDICLKHDGSRIIQSLYKYGTPEQPSSIPKVDALFVSDPKELLPSVVTISKTKHGHFLVVSMLRYSSKEDINAFLEAINGKLQSMCTNQMASVGIFHIFDCVARD